MKVAFFTSERFPHNEVFLYMFAHVAARFEDAHIVAVRRPADRSSQGTLKKLRRIWQCGTGPLNTVETVLTYPVQKLLVRRDQRQAEVRMRILPRPSIKPEPEKAIYVDSVNGPGAVGTLSALKPDLVIQFDAGILKKPIFEVARIGTLNLHPGIAPLIKGRDSIYWALWNQEPGWLGATVHYIDEGIDTGTVLAYAPVEPRYLDEPYPILFVRVHEAGVGKLVETLSQLADGERWKIDPPWGKRVYRSTISGWKLFLLKLRGVWRRRGVSGWRTAD